MPMGELLRRYWHPVGLASDADATPRKLRILGEDLILFRDTSGRPGLLYPRCMHRGTSLYYGRVEDRGIRCMQLRAVEGKTFRRVTEAVLPTLRVVPSPRVGRYGVVESIGWVLPIDDTTFRIYVAGRVREPGELGRMRSKYRGKTWHELNEQEHRETPGDYEAQVGQGAITFHSEEHLRTSDKGVALLRRMLRAQLAIVADGGDPLGAGAGAADAPIRLDAGNFIDD